MQNDLTKILEIIDDQIQPAVGLNDQAAQIVSALSGETIDFNLSPSSGLNIDSAVDSVVRLDTVTSSGLQGKTCTTYAVINRELLEREVVSLTESTVVKTLVSDLIYHQSFLGLVDFATSSSIKPIGIITCMLNGSWNMKSAFIVKINDVWVYRYLAQYLELLPNGDFSIKFKWVNHDSSGNPIFSDYTDIIAGQHFLSTNEMNMKYLHLCHFSYLNKGGIVYTGQVLRSKYVGTYTMGAESVPMFYDSEVNNLFTGPTKTFFVNTSPCSSVSYGYYRQSNVTNFQSTNTSGVNHGVSIVYQNGFTLTDDAEIVVF